VIVIGVAMSVLFYAKSLSLSHAGLEFNRPNLVCFVPLFIGFSPALLLIAYVFASASSWRN
jgi:hypothetical protein